MILSFKNKYKITQNNKKKTVYENLKNHCFLYNLECLLLISHFFYLYAFKINTKKNG